MTFNVWDDALFYPICMRLGDWFDKNTMEMKVNIVVRPTWALVENVLDSTTKTPRKKCLVL